MMFGKDREIPISPDQMAGREKERAMKRTLFSLMALVLVFGLVGAGVVALFSDTEMSTGNVFTAGTLDLIVTGGSFNLTDIAPDSKGTHTYTLTNNGSLRGFLDLSGVVVTNSGGANPESEGQAPGADMGELGANLLVTVTIGGTIVYPTGTLNGFAAVLPDQNISLAAGASTTLVIAWELPVAVGNIVQGDSVTLDFTVELAQTIGQ